MTTRLNEEFERRSGSARAARFVLVNERIPRADGHCAMCSARIEPGYVRDPNTRLVYCDTQCFGQHKRMSAPAAAGYSRRVS
jgi:hypothetical protein